MSIPFIAPLLCQLADLDTPLSQLTVPSPLNLVALTAGNGFFGFRKC